MVEPEPCAERVEITWLGVTTYAVSYAFEGRTVRILLDHQINGTYYRDALSVLGFEDVDYVVIGHNHLTIPAIVSSKATCSVAVPWSPVAHRSRVGWRTFEELAVGAYGARPLDRIWSVSHSI